LLFENHKTRFQGSWKQWQEANVPDLADHPMLLAREPDTPPSHILTRVAACPHLEQILLAGELLGFDAGQVKADERFCGWWVVGVSDLGGMAGRQGDEFYPERICRRLQLALQVALEQASAYQDNPLPASASTELTIELTQVGLKLAGEEVERLQQRLSGRYWLDQWQKVLGREGIAEAFEGVRPICNALSQTVKSCPCQPKEGFFGWQG